MAFLYLDIRATASEPRHFRASENYTSKPLVWDASQSAPSSRHATRLAAHRIITVVHHHHHHHHPRAATCLSARSKLITDGRCRVSMLPICALGEHPLELVGAAGKRGEADLGGGGQTELLQGHGGGLEVGGGDCEEEKEGG